MQTHYVNGMIKNLLSILNGEQPASTEDKTQAARVAIAALLAEAAWADGEYLDAERTTIEAVLAERFGLEPAAARALREEGEAAQSEAVDLVRFTRVVKDSVPFEDRVEVLEALWRVIYADGNRDAEEGNLIRRLAGLLYVPDREAGLARQRVMADWKE